MRTATRTFSAELLRLDCAREAAGIESALREQVGRLFKKKGVVVGLSGGIDSSVVGALAVRAFGADRVLGLLMPERDSAPETLALSRQVVEHLGIRAVHEDISGVLEALGCYRRRDEAIRTVIPEYGADWKCKLALPSVIERDQYRVFTVIAQSPKGRRVESRLTLEAYLGVVAATNFKQRTRKMLEYYHADRLNYAVAGTASRVEYDQGFFVKQGDGVADVKPIAHLYKTQIFQLAEFLGIPENIRARTPSTDTYSLPQTQEEFYFSLRHDKMDLVLFGKDQGYQAEEIAPAAGLTAEQVERVFQDIEGKRRAARYLHAPPLLACEGKAPGVE